MTGLAQGVAGGVAGAVLAAGAGRRMGRPKAGVELDGIRLVDRAVAALTAGGCEPVLAVVRAATPVPGARVVVNPDADRGMRSSLACALDALADGGAIGGRDSGHPVGGPAALAVLLVDLPGVGPDAVRAVVQGWRPGRIAVATFGSRRGHPIVMAPELWRAALHDAGGDEGARRFLRAHPDLVDEVAAPGDPADLDTPDDLRDWAGAAGTS